MQLDIGGSLDIKVTESPVQGDRDNLRGLFGGSQELVPTRSIKGIGAVRALAAMEGEADVSPASLHLLKGQGGYVAPVLKGLKQSCPGCVRWKGGGQVQDAEGQVLLSPAAWLLDQKIDWKHKSFCPLQRAPLNLCIHSAKLCNNPSRQVMIR